MNWDWTFVCGFAAGWLCGYGLFRVMYERKRKKWRSVRELVMDLYYSTKALLSILSGFDRLEYREANNRWCSWYPGIPFIDTPYYMCARFKNGRHLPLPLVLRPEQSEYPLQAWVLRKMQRRMAEAVKACAEYEWGFCEKYCEKPVYAPVCDCAECKENREVETS